MRVYYVEDCQLVIFLNLIMLLFFFLQKNKMVSRTKSKGLSFISVLRNCASLKIGRVVSKKIQQDVVEHSQLTLLVQGQQ